MKAHGAEIKTRNPRVAARGRRMPNGPGPVVGQRGPQRQQEQEPQCPQNTDKQEIENRVLGPRDQPEPMPNNYLGFSQEINMIFNAREAKKRAKVGLQKAQAEYENAKADLMKLKAVALSIFDSSDETVDNAADK